MTDETVRHGSNAYTRLLWRTMNALGVADSITRKMMTAVTLHDNAENDDDGDVAR